MTGNTGGPVPPTINNIFILGASGINVAGNPGTSTLTITNTQGIFNWVDSAGGALANHTGYFATAAAVYTLPAGVINGDMVEIVDFTGGGVVVTAQNGDAIRISNTDSLANGTATSSQIGDGLRLVYRLIPKIWVCVPSAAGMWILA